MDKLWIEQIAGKTPSELARDKEDALKAYRLKTQADWSHKAGTPETHQRADRETSASRLMLSGHIDREQAGAWEEIRAAHEIIERDVRVGGVSYEPRIDSGSRHVSSIQTEAIIHLWTERTYSDWRESIGELGAPVSDDKPGRKPLIIPESICRNTLLDVIARDILSAKRAAHIMRCRHERVIFMITKALDLWIDLFEQNRKRYDAADLAAAQAGLL